MLVFMFECTVIVKIFFELSVFHQILKRSKTTKSNFKIQYNRDYYKYHIQISNSEIIFFLLLFGQNK